MSSCSSDCRVFLGHIILQGLVPGVYFQNPISGNFEFLSRIISIRFKYISNAKNHICIPMHSSFCLGTRPLHASKFACTSSSPGRAPGLTHWTLRRLIPFFPSQALHLLHWLTRHLYNRSAIDKNLFALYQICQANNNVCKSLNWCLCDTELTFYLLAHTCGHRCTVLHHRIKKEVKTRLKTKVNDIEKFLLQCTRYLRRWAKEIFIYIYTHIHTYYFYICIIF